MGYGSSKNLLTQHRFQFADDSAVTISTEKDSQMCLTNDALGLVELYA